jgi:hypothetical protein
LAALLTENCGQIPLIKGAKAAGVKVFFPSEFGVVSSTHIISRRGSDRYNKPFDEKSPSPLVKAKRVVLEAAKEEGLPTAVLNNGGFPEYCFIP